MRQSPRLREFPRYPVVAGTALLAIVVTVAWWAKFDVSPLFETAMIRRGYLWQLITSIFPHVGIWHLVFNVYWLWVFGTIVEDSYGHLKTVFLFLLLSAVPNAMEFAFSAGGVGLSGIGYGLFGLLWILSKHDQRFHDAIDRRTVELFIGWFFVCIVTTITNIMPVANIAHGAGAVVGILTGFAITQPRYRLTLASIITGIFLFGLWGATYGRPMINLSTRTGYEEGQWGYEALLANRNQEAIRWFGDAIQYQPKEASYWFNLGIAQQRSAGNDAAARASYLKAADLGNADAEYNLGTMYADGSLGLPKSEKQALYWYIKAADQNNPAALNDVAWLYATSDDPTIRNPAGALQYARKAVDAEKDHPNPNYLDTLAEAYRINGQFEDAIATEQKAIALVDSEQKEEFQSNLLRYQEELKAAQSPRQPKDGAQ